MVEPTAYTLRVPAVAHHRRSRDMKFYHIEPMYGGEAVDSDFSIIDGKRQLSYLRFEVDGDIEDIVSLTYYFAVSDRLKDAIEKSRFSGAHFSPCDVNASDNFKALVPGWEESIKEFRYFQLLPTGKPFFDDFGLIDRYELIVSDDALKVIREFEIGDMEFSETSNE
jgi:hypothetical protein